MDATLKRVVRNICPPVLYGWASSLRRRPPADRGRTITTVEGALRSADWYDERYESSAEYAKHYTESQYYAVWTVIADRLERADVERVLDLGCGPGQFAALLHDRGVTAYRGLDFSATSIRLAQQRCPTYDFATADISEVGVIEASDYDCVVTLEFLEHVDGDVAILQRIRPGTRVFATVPNFPDPGHVRYFADAAEVRDRYRDVFSRMEVDPLLLDPKGYALYLIDGTTG